jgi:hypothetical protein
VVVAVGFFVAAAKRLSSAACCFARIFGFVRNLSRFYFSDLTHICLRPRSLFLAYLWLWCRGSRLLLGLSLTHCGLLLGCRSSLR